MKQLLVLVFVLGCGDDSSPDGGTDASVDAPADTFDAALDAPEPLNALASAPAYADIEESITLDASASTGAETYEWDLGDGRRLGPSDSPTADASWPEPGRYSVVLTARRGGMMRTDSVVVAVTPERVHVPRQSSTIAALPGRRVVALSTDANAITVLSYAAAPTLERRLDTCTGPRTLTPWMRDDALWIAVACADSERVWAGTADGASELEIDLPRGSRPHGVVAIDARLYVTLSGTGQVAVIEGDDVIDTLDAGPDPRGIAVAPDGRLAVSRWRSPDTHGELRMIAPEDGAIELVTLAFDPQPSSDVESGGVPSYLDQIAFSSDGVTAAIPSLQANIGEGTFRSEAPLTFQSSVRGIVSWLLDGVEDVPARRIFDNRGLASAAAFSSRGDYLFVAMRGARSVERVDVLSGVQAGSIIAGGYAPDGVVLGEDDQLLFVNASLSRLVQVYDVSSFRDLPLPIAEIATVDDEPLTPRLLRGKQLFNDSLDMRLARDSYIACAHCHLDGDSDHRVWDFTDRGEGLRRTPPLFGRTDDVPLHWSGNFDEVQDFENDIRAHFQGRGLMSDADFEATADTLGETKAGLSEDLDALAAYVDSLSTHLRSPHRNADGSLPDAAERGRVLFESAGCPTCHSGPSLTDSGFESPGVPRLHDVGTLGSGSGSRLGETLPGIDTPTLHGVWHQPRLLHDGSATLREVISTRNPEDRHGTTSTLTSAELDDLEAYLQCLDG